MAATAQLVTAWISCRSRRKTSTRRWTCTRQAQVAALRLRPRRQYAEFETSNVTLSIADGEAIGIGHNVSGTAWSARRRRRGGAGGPAGRGVQFQGVILDTRVCYMSFFADPDGSALMLHDRYAHTLS